MANGSDLQPHQWGNQNQKNGYHCGCRAEVRIHEELLVVLEREHVGVEVTAGHSQDDVEHLHNEDQNCHENRHDGGGNLRNDDAEEHL